MKKIQIVILIILGFLFFQDCKKKSVNEDRTNPSKEFDVSASIKLSKDISLHINPIITENTNSILSGHPYDSIGFIKKIKAINGIKNAYFSETGTSMVIEQTDGAFLNLLLITEDSPLFTINKEQGNAIGKQKTQLRSTKLFSSTNKIFPTGKKALILAPFEHSFKQNLSVISEMFSCAGYSTTILQDTQVTLDLFRSDFLSGYDLIYISTHGNGAFEMQNNTSATSILTGEIVSDKTTKSLSEDEYAYSSRGLAPGDTNLYYGVSPQFLNCRKNKSFKNTWVFIGACESLEHTDLADYFLNNGTIGYNGFATEIDTTFANAVSIKYISLLTSFNDYDSSVEFIKDDLGFEFFTLINKLSPFRKISFGTFQSKKNFPGEFLLTNIDHFDPFFTTSYGFSGSSFRLYAQAILGNDISSVDQIGSVRYYINGDISHPITLGLDPDNPPNKQYWRYDGKINHQTKIYPITDVYFVNVYTPSGATLTKGNAAFTILGP